MQRFLGSATRTITRRRPRPLCSSIKLRGCTVRSSNPQNEKLDFGHYQYHGRLLFFSSEADTATRNENLEDFTHQELEQLALKYARQAKPEMAQQVLDYLSSLQGNEEALEIIWTSVVDAWIEYQNRQIDVFNDSIKDKDNESILRHQVEEIYHSAEALSNMIEKKLNIDDDSNSLSSHHVFAVLQAWAKASESVHRAALSSRVGEWSGIPQRAQYILDSYFSDTQPNTETVNQVLKAWAYSNEYLRGTMAEQLFQKHFHGGQASPDLYSFLIMMRGWSWSKENRHAFTATGHFMRMMRLLESGQSEIKPTLEDYKTLFQAWTSAEDKNAPSKTHAVLQLINTACIKGLLDFEPDLECYGLVLESMARRVNVPEVGDLVDRTLLEMKRERMLIPNTKCYGSAILAWKHVAMSRENDDREAAVSRVYDLLREMIAAFHRTTIVTVIPTIEHYNHVLEALTVSKLSKSYKKSNELMSELEEASQTFNDSHGLNPTADSYKFALQVLRNSNVAARLEYAHFLFDQLKSRMDQVKMNSSDESIVNAFSMFIEVCATEKKLKGDAEKMENMLTALRVLEEIRQLGLVPNSKTYSSMIEACDKLVIDGNDRQRILDNLFVRCSDEGFVDPIVLEKFKGAASTFLYSKLVVSKSHEVENMKVVPDSWTRNVKGFTVKSRGGKKVLPLTIEGQFTFTKAAAEYKMRKLRKHRNREMLQGGRLK